MIVQELAHQLNFMLSREPRLTTKRVLEFEKIFSRYLQNNPHLASESLLVQLRSWLETAQPHYEEFQQLQYYLIVWLDKKGGGKIEVSKLLKIFSETINNYQPKNLLIDYNFMQTKTLMDTSLFLSN